MRRWWLSGVIALCGCGCTTSVEEPIPTEDASFTTNVPDEKAPTVCSTHNVYWHQPGSWLLTAPQIYMVFWGNYWLSESAGQTQMGDLIVEWNILYNDPNFWAPVSEYGIGQGSLMDTYVNYLTLSNSVLSEDTIQTELQTEISNGSLPAPNTETLYVVLLPLGSQSQADIDNSFIGHHSNYDNQYNYAVIENQTNPTQTIAHETWEACTDPSDGDGWLGDGNETEIADICNGLGTWVLNSYTLPQVWSQKNCQCEPQ